ncbi:MAG: putative minor head protein [Prokaryotic dsDNA virus sp.]|nr:hypothetical protein [Phycisphaerae bacterium]QDP45970.1 MAG: putative minor head protein [Prokaryotic dsDNA virus sp.]
MADRSIDASAQHAVYIERLAATNANNLDAELKALAAFFRERLAREGSTIPTKRAMTAIIADVKKKYGKAYQRWQKETNKFLSDLTKYENGYQTDILNAETASDYKAKKPKLDKAVKAVNDQPLMIGPNGGAVSLAALVGGFAASNTDKVVSLVKTGYYQGRSTTEIIGSVVGTRKNKYKDGVMIGAKRSATNISKSGANHVSTTVSDVVYNENERAVKGYIITAVLDSSTSKTCRGLDDTRVRLDDSYQPRPPFHFGCRTTTRPWLREDLDAIKKAERETVFADGEKYEPTAKEYYSLLKQQPAYFQDDVLGVTEGRIFRNAGLTPAEFKKATIKRDGTPLTIAEMSEKDQRIKDYLSN